jgi:hypothetical protein
MKCRYSLFALTRFFLFLFFVLHTCFTVLEQCRNIVCMLCTVVAVSVVRSDSGETEMET